VIGTRSSAASIRYQNVRFSAVHPDKRMAGFGREQSLRDECHLAVILTVWSVLAVRRTLVCWCQALFLLDVAVVAVFPRSVSNFKQAGNDFGRCKSLMLQGSRCQTILSDYTVPARQEDARGTQRVRRTPSRLPE
jgi:hypothetical protein